jgi:CRISPR-associated endoribonuclease Cas6/Csy4 subtype I-F
MANASLDFRYAREALTLLDERSPVLAQAVLGAVHAWNPSQDAAQRVGLAFPMMTCLAGGPGPAGITPGECLSLIRVTGDPETLEAFAESPAVQALRAQGLCRRLRVREIDPSEIKGYAAYLRERESERKTATAIQREERRLARRAAARGQARDSDAIVADRLRQLDGQDRKPGVRGSIFIPASSRSTGCRFSLTVIRQELTAPSAGPLNGYGLSGADAPCAIPEM